ncbi:MAG: hypothetical protein INR65_15695 [Gluconacetobacter diazotrophicus]|nr:hypothetical protein [Gluconacetobacter diazotrophicus]
MMLPFRAARFPTRAIPFLMLFANGCSLHPTPEPLPGKDVACLNKQIYDNGASFLQAMDLCHTPRPPDLTGDVRLQGFAAFFHIPYGIRPKADAALKEENTPVVTGSHIPGVVNGPVLGY